MERLASFEEVFEVVVKATQKFGKIGKVGKVKVIEEQFGVVILVQLVYLPWPISCR